MTAFHIASNACTGRGFAGTDVNGFLKNLKDWIVKTPNDPDPTQRGAGWYIIDDLSGAGTNPSIVVSDQPSPTFNSRARIIQFQMVTATAQQVQANCYFYWNTTTHVGLGLWDLFNVPTVDSGVFGYDFRGGPDFMWIASYISGTLVFGCMESWDYLPGYSEPDTVIGTLVSTMWDENGTDPNGYLNGYSMISGITYDSNNFDGNFKIYPNFVSLGGGNFRIDIYKDSSRTQLIAHSVNFSTTGFKALVADNSSGVGGSINCSTVPPGSVSTISVEVLTIRLGTGQGSLYTLNNKYFVFDANTIFSGVGKVCVGYYKIRSIVGDVIRLDTTHGGFTAGIDNNKVFGTGAVFGAYPHRFITYRLRDWNTTSISDSVVLPYCDMIGFEYADKVGNSAYRYGDAGAIETSIFGTQTDQSGNFWMQSFGVFTKYDSISNVQAGRLWGTSRNIKVTWTSGLAIYSFGRMLNGKQFMDVYHRSLFFNSISFANSTIFLAWCVRDTPETA